MRWSLTLALAAGCSAPVGGLSPSAGPGERAPPEGAACADAELDRTQQNAEELHRLGLILFPGLLEGRIGAPIAESDRYHATFEIQRAHFGMSFLEGTTALIELDDRDVAALSLPGDYLLGFGDQPYPTRDARGPSLGAPRAIAPSSDRDRLSDLIGYRTDRTPWIAVVRIVGQDEDRTRFETIEAIAGELPAEFSENWSRSIFDAPFPGVSDARWIVSLSHLQYYEAAGTYLGTMIDLRPADDAAIAMVRRALIEPRASLDPELSAFAADYATGWAMHRAPYVVATSVLGRADECCTGAGGTYVGHAIEDDLRGSAPDGLLLRGGHAYYGEEACGDRFLLGLRTFESFRVGLSLSCELGSASLPTDLPTSAVSVELPDSDDNRARTERWLESGEPLYRLAAADAEVDPGDLDAIWSQPVSVDRALRAATHLALVDVVAVEPRDGFDRITLETTFNPHRYDHLPRYRVTLTIACGDDRLRQPGSSWLVPVLVENGPLEQATILRGDAFIIPGVVLPSLRYPANITEALYRFSNF